MIKGKTTSGFEFAVDEKVLDNMELVDAISEVDENPTALSKVVKLLLGAHKKELYDHVRTEDGRVPIEAVTDIIMEIFAAGGKPAKN